MKVKILTVFTLALALFLSACGGGKSDADLQKAASEKLAADKITSVAVAVKDGVATLSGQVDDAAVKGRAANAVKGVDGIKSVTDNTTLKALPPPPEPEQSDPAIKVKIEEGIKKLGLSGINVAVADAEVTLTGTVPKDRLAEVIKAAMEADIKNINNKLVVK